MRNNVMKSNLVVLMAIAIVVSFSFSSGDVFAKSKTLSEKKQGKVMAQVLKEYKKKNFKKAKKLNKKLPMYATEKCVKKMPKAMKKAYLKKVRKTKHLDSYYLADMDNDKKPELFVKVGTCEANYSYNIYRYKSKKVKKIGTIGGGHASLHSYPNHKGVVIEWCHMGYYGVYVNYISKGKIKSKKYYEGKIPRSFPGVKRYLKRNPLGKIC